MRWARVYQEMRDAHIGLLPTKFDCDADNAFCDDLRAESGIVDDGGIVLDERKRLRSIVHAAWSVIAMRWHCVAAL